MADNNPADDHGAASAEKSPPAASSHEAHPRKKSATALDEPTGPTFDTLSSPFQTALAARFDKVPLVWGKDALPLTMENLQNRLKERMILAEARKAASEQSKDTAFVDEGGSDKKMKPEREGKYRPHIQMYSEQPTVSEEKLTAMIYGPYEQRTIDLYYAWEQARQSSELSHVIERITHIDGVTAFIIFDIFEREKYPGQGEGDEQRDDYEEDENGFPVRRDSKLEMVDHKWEIPRHIIYSSTDLMTAKKIIPFVKQLIWRVIETTRDLDPKNEVRYLRLVSDMNEVLVVPMFPRHFLVVVQEPRANPGALFEKMGIVATHPRTGEDEADQSKKKSRSRPRAEKGVASAKATDAASSVK